MEASIQRLNPIKSNPMTKSQEIEILRDTIARLGRDSYCGAWLADQLPAIEMAITSDCLPEVYAFSIREANIHSEKIIKLATDESAQILTDARKEADQIRSKANRFDDEIRAELGRSIQSILNRI